MAEWPLVVIIGPTAVGKTAAAIYLAQHLDGEVISADSRQVFRHMDIGTAKPTPEEQAQAPHHLIDILNPDEELSLAHFQALAYRAIREVTSRAKLPLLVGGTGQYVRAVVEGWSIPEVAPDYTFRLDLEAFANVYGPVVLHDRLARVDPVASGGIDYQNVRRVVRALEVFHGAGQPISELQRRHPPPYRILTIGLTRSREGLYRRVDRRIDEMIEEGFVGEVQRLLDMGYGPEHPAMSSLGYPQIMAYLAGQIALGDAVAEMRRATRRFIRHQSNWFRRDDPSIKWFDLDRTSYEAILEYIPQWLACG